MIALYMRLSVADGDVRNDEKEESNSIENQRAALHDFVERRNDLTGEIAEYIDDGYSGTNFDRPQFKLMLEDMKAGKIDVLITKDLSRLGRNFIEVNPETTATEDAAQVPAETMRINGDVSIGSKAGNTAGALSVTGNVSSGGDITATGDVSVGDDLGVTGDATVGGALGVTGNQTVGGTSTITGALSAASFSTSGNITASNGTVKGKVVDINGFKITGVSFDYGTATLSITYQ